MPRPDTPTRPTFLGLPPVLLAVCAMAVGFLAGVVCGGLLGYFVGVEQGKRVAADPATPPPAVSGDTPVPVEKRPARYTRKEFAALIEGKTPEEIIKLLGIPFSRSEDAGSTSMMRYRKMTFDPLTMNVDQDAFIHFKNGVASPMRY